MEWAVHEACREAKNDACRVLVGKSEGKRLPVRPGVNLSTLLKLNFT
jgi:proteasome lid subunit RPN8/RPN11